MSLFDALIALAESEMRHSLEEEGVILVFKLIDSDEGDAVLELEEPPMLGRVMVHAFGQMELHDTCADALEHYRGFHLGLNEVTLRPPRKCYLDGCRRATRPSKGAPIRVMEGYNFR